MPPTGTLDNDWGRGPADKPYRVQRRLTSTQLRNVTANLSLNASDGFPYNQVTGFDDNGDGLINDRPAGVGIWMLRTTPVWTLSTRVQYTLPIGATPAVQGLGPAAAQRYRMGVYVSVNNLTNHANLTGFSGVMTSPFFRTATNVQNPRKVDMGFNLTF